MGKIERITREVKCITNADSIILNYPEHRAQENRVNLHYYHADWQPNGKPLDCNLGDYLSEVIVKLLCAGKGIDFNKVLPTTRHLYAIGSIIQMGYQNATLWETGFAFEVNKIRALPHLSRKLDIRCVRGPRTRKNLLKMGFECPESYGDPGVVMPLLYQPNTRKTTDYLIIPHFQAEAETRKHYGDLHMLSMNTNDYQGVIDRICSAKKVVSSSLHGIILAEAYGIPAVFYQDRPEKFNFKYQDWYESTGRVYDAIPHSIEDGLNAEAEPVDQEKIKVLQETLIESFPSDLWGGV